MIFRWTYLRLFDKIHMQVLPIRQSSSKKGLLMKKKSTFTSPINKYTIEIDYNKLAEAITKANEKISSKELKEKKKSFRIKLIRFINGCIYVFYGLLCLSQMFKVWDGTCAIVTNNPAEKIIITIFLGIVVIVCFLLQQESLDETSEQSIDHININLALIALILAVVALKQ